ncbi:hypothetical protein GCM10010360_27560 [Streptomyces nogalater]
MRAEHGDRVELREDGADFDVVVAEHGGEGLGGDHQDLMSGFGEGAQQGQLSSPVRGTAERGAQDSHGVWAFLSWSFGGGRRRGGRVGRSTKGTRPGRTDPARTGWAGAGTLPRTRPGYAETCRV